MLALHQLAEQQQPALVGQGLEQAAGPACGTLQGNGINLHII
jgi:hypothetical protein